MRVRVCVCATIYDALTPDECEHQTQRTRARTPTNHHRTTEWNGVNAIY